MGTDHLNTFEDYQDASDLAAVQRRYEQQGVKGMMKVEHKQLTDEELDALQQNLTALISTHPWLTNICHFCLRLLAELHALKGMSDDA